MKSQKLHLFWAPVYVRELEGEELERVQTQIKSAMDQLEVKGSPWDDEVSSSFNFDGTNDIVNLGMNHLTDAIFESLRDWCGFIKYPTRPFRLVDSWLNVYDSKNFMYDHVHPERAISGCYYYQADGDEGNLTFKSPNPVDHLRLWPADMMPQRQSHHLQPKTGTLIMFPSWLTHKVGVNRTDKQRISIAFNLA
jgi:hypothetical protein